MDRPTTMTAVTAAQIFSPPKATMEFVVDPTCQSTIRLLYFPRMKFSLLHKLKFLLESVHHSGQDIPAVADPDLPGAVLPCRRNAKTISSPSLQIRIEKYHALTGGTTCNCAPSYSAEFPSYRAVA